VVRAGCEGVGQAWPGRQLEGCFYDMIMANEKCTVGL